MGRLFRKLCFVLTFVMSVSTLQVADVYADETVNRPAPQPKELTGIQITGVDIPVGGAALDKAATITSAEGESWDIPVIWMDETGAIATVAEAGKRYIPTFALHVPAQFVIKGMSASGKFPVGFPAFLTVQGTDKFIYTVDPSTQIIYIFCAPGYVAGPAGYTPGQDPVKTVQDESNNSSADKDDSRKLSLLEKYCAQSAIDHFQDYPDFLEWLIDVLINEIQPQAVSLLVDGFPAFKEASQNGELSSKIGLYIYYKTGSINGEAIGSTPAVAMFDGSLVNDRFRLTMAVNAEYIETEYDETTGQWSIKPESRDMLDNTIVHEMFHGFSFDYTRCGTMGSFFGAEDLGYPNWFIEGSATAVENAYQYHYNELTYLMSDDWNVVPDPYDKDSVKYGYDNETLAGDSFKLNDSKKSTVSAYTSGYLAVVYLGYLDAKSRGLNVDRPDGTYDIDIIRDGVNDIYRRLHGTGDGSDSDTLDSIIKDISDFSGTQDFQDRFITNDDGSLTFTTNYLNMLNSIDTSADPAVECANGSLLLGNDEQAVNSPLKKGERPGDPEVYRVQDDQGSAVSDVSDVRANTTGGTSVVGDGTYYFLAEDKDEPAAAAKSDPAALFAEVPPAAEISAVETPVVEAPTGEVPVVETFAAQTPVAEIPVVETPVVETPVVEAAAAQTPVVEIPTVEESAEETPAEEAPEAETPAA